MVVLPAFSKPARADAVTYLAGGPGEAATELAADLSQQLSALNVYRDILLVDQRGTGRSSPDGGDVTQYGTRMAMEDLEAVRAALGYRQLDVIGSSYGATAAQIYLKLHPSSVRTLILSGATAIDVPFFGRFAVNAQRALDQLANLCASDADCRETFPGWERQFGELVKAWNADPEPGVTGYELASVVHVMLLDGTKAASIPLLVSSAAKGDYTALEDAEPEDLDVDLNLMGRRSGATSPGRASMRQDRGAPTSTATRLRGSRRSGTPAPPSRSAPSRGRSGRSPPTAPCRCSPSLAAPTRRTPVANLSDLKQHFPDSRTMIFPHVGHSFGIGGCLYPILTDFVDRGTTEGLDTTRCDGAVVVPPFSMPD